MAAGVYVAEDESELDLDFWDKAKPYRKDMKPQGTIVLDGNTQALNRMKWAFIPEKTGSEGSQVVIQAPQPVGATYLHKLNLTVYGDPSFSELKPQDVVVDGADPSARSSWFDSKYTDDSGNIEGSSHNWVVGNFPVNVYQLSEQYLPDLGQLAVRSQRIVVNCFVTAVASTVTLVLRFPRGNVSWRSHIRAAVFRWQTLALASFGSLAYEYLGIPERSSQKDPPPRSTEEEDGWVLVKT